jgi:ATPase subunit of ABC transporter with duplicated ATPase domains
MRGVLAADNVTKLYGAELVLDRVSLAVPPRARIGVVGPNGSGKSTLLRVLAGLEQPDDGVVERRPPSLRVGYLPQEQDAEAEPGITLLAYLAARTGVGRADAQLDALARRLELEPKAAQEYADALDRFLGLGGEDFVARARSVTSQLGLAAGQLEQAVGTMSGGEAARKALAAILLSRLDVLLLDEPTNNLDFSGLELLEQFVAETPSALVTVSHDRAFLERSVNRIVELEAETRRVREYAGSWADYERTREAGRRSEEEAYSHFVEERARFGGLLRDRRDQARAAGAMADRRGTHALSSKVRSAARRLERLEEVDKPWQPWRLQLSLPARARGGDVVARLDGAVVVRGGFRLGPTDLELRQGDRLAIVGPNGSGKSTLIDALVGRLPLSGGSRHVGPGTRFGELDQHRSTFTRPEGLLGLFTESSGLAPTEARTLLGRFALRGDAVLRAASSLSPGERTRATLALLAAQGANTLVLDEPTNHLDLEAIEQLESALEDYEGTIVLVTHDRRLLERFQPTRRLELGQ